MVAIFLPLVVLAFATVQFEGALALFPTAFLSLWLSLTAFVLFYCLPHWVRVTDSDEEFNRLASMQGRLQWGIVLWIILLQAGTAPASLISRALTGIFPQTWPMLFSTLVFIALVKVSGNHFHHAYQKLTCSDQSPDEYFRARMTLPILFFPPMLLWMAVEDLLSTAITLPMLSELWIMAVAPFFFVGLYLLSPYLFNIAWEATAFEDKEYEAEIMQLARASETPITGVKVWNTFKEPLANAAVAGLADRYRFVYITRYLLGILERKDILAILAHELGHFRLGHVWTYLLFTIVLVILSVVGKLYLYFHHPWLSDLYGDYSSLLDPLFFILVFLVIFTSLTRYSEKQADRFAASLVGPEHFARAMENLQEYLGVPRHKLPWWLETHPEFTSRIVYSREPAEPRPTLISRARGIRAGLIVIAIGLAFLGFDDTRHTWLLAKATRAVDEGQLRPAAQYLDELETHIGRHPRVLDLQGRRFWKAGQWANAFSIAAEKTWGVKLPLLGSEEFHHATPPEVALQLQIVQFLLKTLHFRGVHGIPLFDQGLDLFETGLGQ